jgi:hypothetical protein
MPSKLKSKLSGKPKRFTVQQANAMLPLVSAIALDLRELSRTVIDRRERLALLRRDQAPDEGSDPYRDELLQIEEELEKDADQLSEYIDELRDLGVEPKNALDGLIDFPSKRNGRDVYLCWKLDEPAVLFWHDIDAGFRGRQPLDAKNAGATDQDADEDVSAAADGSDG